MPDTLPTIPTTLDRGELAALADELRVEHPLVRTELGFFEVLDDATCRELLADPRLGAVGMAFVEMPGVTDGALHDWWHDVLFTLDGERHDRLRRLVARAFTPRQVQRLRPRMRVVTEQIIDRFAPSGRCEFVGDFADEYPVRIISALLDLPPDDFERFRSWSTDIGLAFGLSIAQHIERIDHAVAAMHEYVAEIIEMRRRQHGDDLVSALIAVEEQGDRLSDHELRSLVVNIVFAGHDTTRNQLGLGMLLFARHHDQWALLADEPSLASQATLEVVRLDPTVGAIPRVALEDVDVHGHRVPAGAWVMIATGAANRDPDAYGEPTRFDITRQGQQSLTFGHGFHYCLGASLAKAEMEEALPILARRLRDPVVEGEIRWRPPLVGITGPEALPLRFEPERP